jgi:hypothetical protein
VIAGAIGFVGNRLPVLALAASLMVPALNVKAEPMSQCRFVYTDEVRDEIVAPAVKKAAGPHFGMYDLKAPVVSPYHSAYGGKRRLLLLTFDRKPKGHFPSISVIFDPCLKRLVPAGPFE